jgi:hypothetical protein
MFNRAYFLTIILQIQTRRVVNVILVYWGDHSPMAQQPLVGQGLLIIDASRSHPGTPHSVRLLWTSDQPDAETST